MGYKTTLELLTPRTAEGESRQVLEKGKAFSGGMLPNMFAAMAHAPEAMETYMFGYKAFREKSGFTPAEQEVVFLVISYENSCEYCIAGHSFAADVMSNVPFEVTEAIRNDEPVPDARLGALAEFTRVMLLSRGRPSREEVDAFLAAGYTEKQILDIVLAIAVKTISNYTNHVFDTPVDGVMKIREWKSFRAVNRMVRFLRRGKSS